ncbi:MAG: isoprenyl transferase [Lachnospiraceae bacterium]|nr:isoprenyl transferase [Lachnospiraceae bacterium]
MSGAIPRHVAIILDGNGRWAKSKGMPRVYGHTMGAKNVETVCRAAWNMGIQYLTMYAFSTENWNRPGDEVSAIMDLLRSYLKTCKKTAKKNNMRVRVLGEKSRLAPDIQESIAVLEEYTRQFDGLNFQIALNYGSRDEITRAVNRIIEDRDSGVLDRNEPVTEELIASYLDTAGIPDPDLLIRTSGEQRLSNYLLWQCAYTEFYFVDIHWPDFRENELRKAVEDYGHRSRRYGKTGEQIVEESSEGQASV